MFSKITRNCSWSCSKAFAFHLQRATLKFEANRSRCDVSAAAVEGRFGVLSVVRSFSGSARCRITFYCSKEAPLTVLRSLTRQLVRPRCSCSHEWQEPGRRHSTHISACWASVSAVLLWLHVICFCSTLDLTSASLCFHVIFVGVENLCLEQVRTLLFANRVPFCRSLMAGTADTNMHWSLHLSRNAARKALARAWNGLSRLCPTRGPRAACGPVEGFVRPSLGFRCSEKYPTCWQRVLVLILKLYILMQVVFSATLSRLLSLQLGFKRIQRFLVC